MPRALYAKPMPKAPYARVVPRAGMVVAFTAFKTLLAWVVHKGCNPMRSLEKVNPGNSELGSGLRCEIFI